MNTIHKYKKLNNILILVIIFTILFNFAIDPKKVSAVGGTLAAIYGIPTATQLLAFILTCFSIGLTFKTHDDAKKMFDMIHDNPTKWEVSQELERLKEQINQAYYNISNGLPPDGGNEPPKGWKPDTSTFRDIIKQMLYGGAIGGAAYELINKIKDFFQSLGAKSGNNVLTIEGMPFIIDTYEFELSKGQTVTFVVEFDGMYYTGEVYSGDSFGYGETYHGARYKVGKIDTGSFLSFRNDKSFPMIITKGDTFVRIGVKNNSSSFVTFEKLDFIDVIEEIPVSQNLVYNITNNSYITTNVPPSTTPQPNISNLPNVKQVITPDGKVVQQYEGDTDALIDDILENTPVDNLTNFVSSGSYTLYERDTGTGIITEIVPETGDLPFPDLENPEIPESELQGQGIIITLLKSIVNWLYNLWQLPQKLLKDFFIPQPDYLKLKLDTIKISIDSKIQRPDIGPIKTAFQGLT